MTRILCSLALISMSAWADETADRIAMDRVIAALNINPPDANLFTADADGRSLLEALRHRPAYTPVQGPPTITISREPWGEATINWVSPISLPNPLITIEKIRFITPDVALLDARVFITSLLFVMERIDGDWKIASVRLMQPH